MINISPGRTESALILLCLNCYTTVFDTMQIPCYFNCTKFSTLNHRRDQKHYLDCQLAMLGRESMGNHTRQRFRPRTEAMRALCRTQWTGEHPGVCSLMSSVPGAFLAPPFPANLIPPCQSVSCWLSTGVPAPSHCPSCLQSGHPTPAHHLIWALDVRGSRGLS